jgi:hypothetical protein
VFFSSFNNIGAKVLAIDERQQWLQKSILFVSYR